MSSLEWLLCVAVALLLTGSTVFARENISHQSTVDELLQLDSQAALLTAKKNIFGVTQQLHVGSDADVFPNWFGWTNDWQWDQHAVEWL